MLATKHQLAILVVALFLASLSTPVSADAVACRTADLEAEVHNGAMDLLQASVTAFARTVAQPVVGHGHLVVTQVINLLWPEHRDGCDVWTATQESVQDMIDESVMEEHLRTTRNRLDFITEKVQLYSETPEDSSFAIPILQQIIGGCQEQLIDIEGVGALGRETGGGRTETVVGAVVRGVQAVGEDDGWFGIYIECETDDQCNHYRGFQNVSPAPPGIGTTILW